MDARIKSGHDEWIALHLRPSNQAAGRPRSIPAMPRSSSRSGQWMPIGISLKRPRTVALASRSRGYHASGVANLAAVRQHHHQLIRGEGNADRPDIADINFQSAHAIYL
jgi:hypothetical protein